jgi:hypothetical protein
MDLKLLYPTARPWRVEPAFGCNACFAQDDCGGWYGEGFDCFDATCCGKTKTCKYACPRSENFHEVYRDTDGFSSFREWSLRQNKDYWPEYIPVVQNKSSRQKAIHRQVIAIPTSRLLRWGSQGEKAFRSRTHLQQTFKLTPTTEVVALSIEKDPPLETYWKFRKVRDSVSRLRSLGIRRIICPDFSTGANLPRLDNLSNRKRSLICAEEFSRAGISVVPFLHATTEFDWNFWLWFLKEHGQITTVAKEFQTGAHNRRIGQWHCHALLELEQKLGRGLHLVAVGGRKFIPQLVKLHGLTIMDSNPFIKSIKRQRLTIKDHRWTFNRTPQGAPVDDLLNHNMCVYEQYIIAKIRAAGGRSRRHSMRKVIDHTRIVVHGRVRKHVLPLAAADPAAD